MKPVAPRASPAYPAFVLLFGMVFGLAFVHLLDVAWSFPMTAAFYLGLFGWVLMLAWRDRQDLLPVVPIDLVFVGFLLLVLVSSMLHGGFLEEQEDFVRYLPFLVVGPYVCGRLMREADIVLLARIGVLAGLFMLPLLLLDYMNTPDRGGPRWPFFGQDHGALLVGELLMAALLATCVRRSESQEPVVEGLRPWSQYALAALLTGVLVWVSARGWLLSAIAGIGALMLGALKDRRLLGSYSRQFVLVVAVVGLSLMLLPRPTGQFYARLLTRPAQVAVPAGGAAGTTATAPVVPAVEPELCQVFTLGVNSVAMRWVMYREAAVMFYRHPIQGVGAARFGEGSCTGPGGYPHSTILQALSELGVIGGGSLLGLLSLGTLVLVRRMSGAVRDWRDPSGAFAFAWALFAAFAVADQLYGNYFMSSGTYLMLGMGAGLYADQKRRGTTHG